MQAKRRVDKGEKGIKQNAKDHRCDCRPCINIAEQQANNKR